MGTVKIYFRNSADLISEECVLGEDVDVWTDNNGVVNIIVDSSDVTDLVESITDVSNRFEVYGNDQ